ncbi:MAG: hypothetical protein ABI591_07615 [Kofleriaceae bacterium]
MRWGGKRAGAGRPQRGAVASEPHQRRPALSARVPVHVIARVVRGAGALHDRHARRALARAVQRSLARTDFRIVELAVVAGRLELVVEAADRHALARGMQGFQVAAARHLNRLRGRSGAVFPDRYRARPLLTRGAVRALLHAPIAWIRHAWPETVMLVATLLPPPPTPPPPDEDRETGRYP